MYTEKLAKLHESILQTVQEAQEKDLKKYLSELSKGLYAALEITEQLGAEAYVLSEDDEENIKAHIITFHWSEYAKSFFILWRNILFESHKAQVLLKLKKTDDKAIEDLRLQNKEVLLAAAKDLINLPDKEIQMITALPKTQKKFIEGIKAQTNPWTVYQKQFLFVKEQVLDIEKKTKILLTAGGEFDRIVNHIRKIVINSQSEIAESKRSLGEIISFVEENAEKAPAKIVKYLEDNETKTVFHSNLPQQVSSLLKEETSNLPEEVKYPVSINGGLVEVKEINLRRLTRQWLESEILPLLYEIDEITDNVHTGLKLSLINIKNRAILMNSEIKDSGSSQITPTALCRPLTEFEKSTQKRKEEGAEIYKTINERFAKDFSLDKIYENPEEFLELPLQKTINQFIFSRNEWFAEVRKSWNNLVGKFRDLRSDVKREDALSISEKVVRYLEKRSPDPANAQYSAIFLTKGFVGESFRVGRQEEIKRIEKLINQWKSGFRGTVIISGQRFAGKTLFGDLVAEKFFPSNCIQLFPYSEVKVMGRTFTTTCDLKEALDFIKKYTQQSQSLLWIDNLELWSSEKVSLAENVRALQNFTDTYAGKIFTLVSMSNWLKHHLDKNMELDRYFQAEINMDQISKADIHRAIAIRHGATHKKIVNDDGEEIGPRTFHKMTSATYRHSGGNIGEALLSWANSLEKTDNEEVRRHNNPDPPLPDFISSDTAIILSTIMLNKRTNEYELSKLFGSVWRNKYSGILQRLLGLGLLTRSLDGRLEVDERAVNDIAKLLAQHKYLRY